MKLRKKIYTVIYHIVTFSLGFLMIFPIIWLILASFKESSSIMLEPLKIFPDVWMFSNYTEGWKGFGGGNSFSTFFKNSLVISITATIGAVLFSTVVAYGFSRIRFKGRGFWFVCMMLTMMLPMQVLVIPQYILFNIYGWIGTLLPLILPYFFGQGFFIFLTMQFIGGIPYEMDEAARIDGCSRYTIFLRIILPLVRPAIITSTIFSFYWRWDDFFGPLLYCASPQKYTVSIALKLFSDPESLGEWGPMFAMATLSLLPVLAIFLFFQKYLVEGISTTGLKA